MCSLGTEWSATVAAATRYIQEPDAANPSLTTAYVARIEANLRLHNEPDAVADATKLLTVSPYTPDVAEITDLVLDYTRFVRTEDAIGLATARQPYVLAALRTTPPPTISPAPGNAAPVVFPPAHTLFLNGLRLAKLQQLEGHEVEAQATVAQLDAALPQLLSPDDALPIADARQQYALLGKPLTGVKPLKLLDALPNQHLPTLPALHAITALLLFPDWCAQCVRMGAKFPKTVFSVKGHSAYLYGLLVQTTPPEQPPRNMPNIAYQPGFAAADLADTPTVTVIPGTLTAFAATTFPLMIVTDANGIVRALAPITLDDLDKGGAMDAVVARIGDTFPVHLPGHTVAPRPSSATPH